MYGGPQVPWQKRKAHSKKENLTAKKKKKPHCKKEKLTAEVKNLWQKLKTCSRSKNSRVFGCHLSLVCCMMFIISYQLIQCDIHAHYCTVHVACQCDHVFFLMWQRK